MEPIEKMAELDAKGILPYPWENPDQFLYRGYRLFALAMDPRWVHQFMKKELPEIPEKWHCDKVRFPAPDTSSIRNFQKGVTRFGTLTHTDLSWVPVFGFWDSRRGEEGALGISLQRTFKETRSFLVPMMGVRTTHPRLMSAFDTGAHEAFHTVRYPLFFRIDGRRVKDTDKDEYEFDHLGGMIISRLSRWAATGPVERRFVRAEKYLRKSLGDNAWYALTRLSYDETLEHVLEDQNTRGYLLWAAGNKDNLRHRIICHRLGL